MQYLDFVTIIKTTPETEALGVKAGMDGAIVLPEIRDNTFMVEVFNFQGDTQCVTPIDVSHLKLRERNDLTDAEILATCPGITLTGGANMKMAKFITLKANKNLANKNKKIFTTHNEYLFLI